MIVFRGVREPIKVAWLAEPMVETLNLLGVWSARKGIDVTIHSMNDHTHKKNSLHGRDLALDFKVDHQDPEAMDDCVNYLKQNLSLGFDILWKTDSAHMNHCHVEFDVKQRRGAWQST